MMSDFMTAISDLVSPADIMNRSQLFFNVSQINLDSDGYTEDFKKNGQINITGRSFIIRGLSHFTQYQISVSIILKLCCYVRIYYINFLDIRLSRCECSRKLLF